MLRTIRAALALALSSALGLAGAASAQTVKGLAEVGYLKPVTKVQGTDVVTTFKVKNLSKGTIVGLKIEEFWYDKEDNLLPGGIRQLREPLKAGEVATMELRTRRSPKMDRNSYRFTHTNGQVNMRLLAKIE